MNPIKLLVSILLIGQPVFAQRMNFKQSDLRSEEGIVGAVRSIQTEETDILERNGKQVEGERRLVAIARFESGGNRSEVLQFHEGAVYRRITYVHDTNGRRAEEIEYDQLGVLSRRMIFKLVSPRNSVEALEYDSAGNVAGRIVYVYRVDGKIKKLIQDDRDNDIEHCPIWVVFRYLTNSRVDAVYCSGNVESRNRDMGFRDAKRPCGGGRFSGKNTFFYDKRGIAKRENLNTIRQHVRYDYQFDANGNWTKRVTRYAHVSKGRVYYEPSSVTYRTLTYYSRRNRGPSSFLSPHNNTLDRSGGSVFFK